MTEPKLGRFYVIETLKVGYFVDAKDPHQAEELVMTSDPREFDVLEYNKIESVQVVDDEFPFSLEDD